MSSLGFGAVLSGLESSAWKSIGEAVGITFPRRTCPAKAMAANSPLIFAISASAGRRHEHYHGGRPARARHHLCQVAELDFVVLQDSPIKDNGRPEGQEDRHVARRKCHGLPCRCILPDENYSFSRRPTTGRFRVAGRIPVLPSFSRRGLSTWRRCAAFPWHSCRS